MMRKIMTLAFLIICIALSACNLSQSGIANEVALNPPTLETGPTRTPISFNNPTAVNPTRTAVAAPTITVLGGNDIAAQPASQRVDVAAASTQLPPEGVCSLKSTGDYAVNVRRGPGASFEIMSTLEAGQYTLVIKEADNGWLQIPWGREAVGWVSPKVVTLYGPCENLRSNRATEMAVPSMTPTPTGQFGFTMNVPLNHLITKVTVGSIPAGTTVMVNTTQFTGSEYLYEIVTADGRYETARDSDLALSENGGTMLFPTPTPYVFVPSATIPVTVGPTMPPIYFLSELGMGIGVYRVATTTAVGNIPAGTAVRLSSAEFNGSEWTYLIVTRDGRSATARESQLAYIPNAGGGGPTPTDPVVITPTIPVMDLPSGSSPSDVVIPDALCTVTAHSATNLVARPGSSTVVGILNPGPWAQVGAKNGQGWYKVTIWTDGSQGWTTTSTVTLHGPCEALPVE